MRRREFITLLGGAAVASPLVARAQQPELPVVGFVRSTSRADSAHLIASFRRGLKEAGYTEGENVTVEYRWADNQIDRLPALVADLMRQKMAVIVANVTSAFAVKAATTAIPVVFVTGNDPVKDGLVTNINRPSGNLTGVVFFSDELGTKRLELLRQLVPKATTIGVLVSSKNPGNEQERRNVEVAARATGLQTIMLDATSDPEIETAFATLVERRVDAMFVGSGAFLFSNRDQLVALAARYRIPASYSLREFVTAGGLMSYGASITESYRQAGIYAGRILKGEKPADLPVMRSAKFEFVLNLKTAKAIGMEVPANVLALADEVIE
jgi:putative tryptophan/tyrosine transport system substrate-binding protein